MIIVYTAPWIIPIASEIIQTGAVAVQDEIIIDVGKEAEILANYTNSKVIQYGGILMPPLVNCHTHLELSHITDIRQPPPGTPMISWIRELMEKRMGDTQHLDIIAAEAKKMVDYQFANGVGLLVNIGNYFEKFPPQSLSYPEIYSIYEVLAPTAARVKAVLDEIEELPQSLAISPHAVYSSSADLIRTLKARARHNNQIFSIHIAESADENALLQTQNGPFHRFLEERDSWDNTLLPEKWTGSAIEYLESLDVLDEQTICVHCVHVDDNDIEILQKRKTHICICPGSNKFLGVGESPVDKFLNAGLLPTIGTDSRASNRDVNLWQEMQLIRHMNSDLDPLEILKMATLGGAKALQRSDDYGILAPGKKALILEIKYHDLGALSEQEIVDRLTGQGPPEEMNWILPEQH